MIAETPTPKEEKTLTSGEHVVLTDASTAEDLQAVVDDGLAGPWHRGLNECHKLQRALGLEAAALRLVQLYFVRVPTGIPRRRRGRSATPSSSSSSPFGISIQGRGSGEDQETSLFHARACPSKLLLDNAQASERWLTESTACRIRLRGKPSTFCVCIFGGGGGGGQRACRWCGFISIGIAVKGTTKMRKRIRKKGKEEEREGTPGAKGLFVTVNEMAQ